MFRDGFKSLASALAGRPTGFEDGFSEVLSFGPGANGDDASAFVTIAYNGLENFDNRNARESLERLYENWLSVDKTPAGHEACWREDPFSDNHRSPQQW